MSRGLRTQDLPKWIKKGIDSAFREWLNMSGEWLNTAPEYFVTVHIAQQLKRNVDTNQRTIFMRSKEEALEWVRRFPQPFPDMACTLELRQLYEEADFAPGGDMAPA